MLALNLASLQATLPHPCSRSLSASCRQRFRIRARAHYYDRQGWWKCKKIVWNNPCLPVGKKKPTFNGQLKRVLRYEKNN